MIKIGRLQQDNAPYHVFKATQKFIKVNTVPRPKPENPNCNPIENLWHDLKHYTLTTVKPHNKEKLIQGMNILGNCST